PTVAPGAIIRPPSATALSALAPLQRTQLLTGSVEDRQKALASLDADTRKLILAAMPPQALDGLSAEIREESAKLRKAEQEEIQLELRRRMPPLQELLTQEQIRTARMGSKEEKLALINSFDAEKRQQVIRALGPQLLELPELRREVLSITQPQQAVN